MPANKARMGSVRIDTVPLPERTAKGIIRKTGEKYILEVERRKIEIPISPVMPEAEIRPLSEKEVTVFFSKTKPGDIVAIGTWPTPEITGTSIKRIRIICYFPPPDIIQKLNPRVREAVIREMVREKIISTTLARSLRAG